MLTRRITLCDCLAMPHETAIRRRGKETAVSFRNYAAAARQYDSQSPDESGDARDEAVAERAAELLDAYLLDHAKVREAFAEVICQDVDNLVGIDFATAFCAWHEAPDDVKAENIVGRFHAFMREMLPLVRGVLAEEAQTEAERAIAAEDDRNANDAAEAGAFRMEDAA